MKILKNIAIAFLGITIASCSNNDQPNPTASCPNTDIIGLAFTGGINANQNALFGYFDNSTPTSTLVPTSTVTIPATSTSYFQMSSANNAVYNPTTGDYKLAIPKEQKLITINSAGVLSSTNIPPLVTPPGVPYTDIVNAPLYLGGNLYFGHITNVGAGASNMKISVLDSGYNIIKSVLIPNTNISGNATWQFSSATDGINHIYFAFGNNIVTYDFTANTMTASMITNAPFNGNIIGLEFKETNKLYAIHEFSSVLPYWTTNSKLVEINIANPTNITKTDVIDLGIMVNFEFFSTTYNECNKKYYLSTRSNLSTGGVSMRIDLAGTPTIVNLPSSPSVWIAGLTLKR